MAKFDHAWAAPATELPTPSRALARQVEDLRAGVAALREKLETVLEVNHLWDGS